MIKKQCPNCRDIGHFETTACHSCGLTFVLRPNRAFIQACVKIGGSVLLFAGLIATTAKYF